MAHRGEQRRLISRCPRSGRRCRWWRSTTADRLMLIDGYLRVEARRGLHRDTAIATMWPSGEIETLEHHRPLVGDKRTALEDAWLLGRLREHGLTMEQL